MCAQQRLMAGAAAVDITPLNYRDVYLAGFEPNRKATGVRDPLFARALYLDDGRTRLALVACDLIGLGFLAAETIRRFVQDVQADHVFLCCTHTHSGPDTLGLWGPALGEIPLASGVDPRYMERLARAVAQAVRKARIRALPAILAAGEDTARKDDLTWNMRQPGYMDHALTVLRADRADGRGTIATLVNYASHPESLWSVNTQISPDYPMAILRTLERKLGGVGLFFSGALGAMVTPGIEQDAPLAQRESFYVSYGNKLAKRAVDCVRAAETIKSHDLDIRTRRVSVPMQNRPLRFAAAVGLVSGNVAGSNAISQVGQIRIGPIQIATMPGELSPAVGLRLKGKMGGTPNFLLCLCNDEIGYVLDCKVFDDPAFAYERSMSMGAQTAERLIRTYVALDG